jgi:hypothetical protein
MLTAQQGRDGSGLIWVAQRVLAAQVVATMVAMVLAAPDFIDRLERPTSCTFGCIDVRGAVFIALLIFLTPVALALTAAALLLRRGRIWPAWVALALNMALVGFIVLVVLELINVGGSCSDMCDSFDFGHVPLLVQQSEEVLLTIPPIASLVVMVLLVSRPLFRPSRPRSTAPEA